MKRSTKRAAPARRNYISLMEQRVQRMSLFQLVGLLAALFAAMGVVMNSSGWVLDYAFRAWTSGPMPYGSRAEIVQLAEKAAAQDAEITKQLGTLETRQSQSIERGALVAESLRDLQINFLRTKISDAELDLQRNPSSDAARKLLLDLRSQLEAAEAMAMRLN
jgi:hypothetical protein